jgi:hypothetical protein
VGTFEGRGSDTCCVEEGPGRHPFRPNLDLSPLNAKKARPTASP